MRTKVLIVVLVASFVFASGVQAQRAERMERGNKNAGIEMRQKRMAQMKMQCENLFTEEQREQMKELRLETAKKVKPLKNELRELGARQKTLTTADKADMKAINSNIEKMADIKADIAKIMAAQHQEVRSMLNDEQLLKFDAMKNRMEGRKMQGNNRGQGERGKRHFNRG